MKNKIKTIKEAIRETSSYTANRYYLVDARGGRVVGRIGTVIGELSCGQLMVKLTGHNIIKPVRVSPNDMLEVEAV